MTCIQLEQAPDPVSAALGYGDRGYSCSEAVVAAFAESAGLPRSKAIRLASGFGGGMGMGETCGAVTASFMIIGMAFGTDRIDESYRRQYTYMQVAEFARRFCRLKGSLRCRDLCAGHDPSTAEGASALRRSGKPRELIGAAAALLAELLSEAGQKPVESDSGDHRGGGPKCAEKDCAPTG